VHLGNLTVRVPPTWHVRRIEENCSDSESGVLLTDLTPRQLRSIRHPSIRHGCTTQWAMSRLGGRYAVVSLDEAEFPMLLRPSSFPLKMSRLGAVPYDCHCSLRYGAIAAYPQTYDLRTYLGKNASPTERRQFAALIRSIAPAHSSHE
jgi:hypothetical protein